MNVTDLADPAAAHRDAVERLRNLSARAAEAQRAVATAEANRRAALLAASSGEATADALRAADDVLADVRRSEEIASATAATAKVAADRAEVAHLHAQAAEIAAEIAADRSAAREAAQVILDAIDGASEALGRLRAAAAKLPLHHRRVTAFNQAVEDAAVANAILRATEPAARPHVRHSTVMMPDLDRAEVAVVLPGLDNMPIDPRRWLLPA